MRKERENNPRRSFIKTILGSFLLLSGGLQLLLTGCGKKDNSNAEANADTTKPVDSCDDMRGISENDLAVREKLGYVEESPIEDNQCKNCNLYLPPKPGQKCGGCMLFKGPVYSNAYCTYWAPKV